MDEKEYKSLIKNISNASEDKLNEIVSDFDNQQFEEIKSLNLDSEMTHKIFGLIKNRAWLERALIKALR